MIRVSHTIYIEESDIEITAIRAQGAGGQHVNKTSSAIHLKFDIINSSLPDELKRRLLEKNDRRITKQGVVVIKSQQYRSQEKNRSEAVGRLVDLIRGAGFTKKKRKPTKPSRSSKLKRLDAKNRRSKTKTMRKRVDY